MKQILTYLDLRTIVNELKDNPVQNDENVENRIKIKPASDDSKKHEKRTSSPYKRPFIGTFIQNVYSLNQRSFYFKTNKSILYLEIASRIHLTSQIPAVNFELTFFCTKLRQYLRRKKIRDIAQIGFDRQVCIDFNQYILVAQIFAGGNLILLDKNDFQEISRGSSQIEDQDSQISNLDKKKHFLHKKNGDHAIKSNSGEFKNEKSKKEIKMRQKIEKALGKKKAHPGPIHDYTPIDMFKKYKIIDLFRPAPEYNMVKGAYFRFNPIELETSYTKFHEVSSFLGLEKEFNEAVEAELKNRIYLSRKSTLRKDSDISKNTPTVNLSNSKNHIKSDAHEIDLNSLNPNEIYIFEFFFRNLFEIFKTNKNYGQIIYKKGKKNTFSPFNYEILNKISLQFDESETNKSIFEHKNHSDEKEHLNDNNRHFYSFNETVDQFFIHPQRKPTVLDKKERVKQSQLDYIYDLEREEIRLRLIAQAIENDDYLDEIFKTLNYVVENKIDWELFKEHQSELLSFKNESKVDICENQTINTGKYKEISIENRIKNIDFRDCTVFIEYPTISDDLAKLLPEKKPNDQNKKEKKKNKKKKLQTDVALLQFKESVYRNANRFYTQSKLQREKRFKIENNLEDILSKIRENKPKKLFVQKSKRPSFWFEKFHFTFTRDNFIVIGGKNAIQNEEIAKREYMYFFHSKIFGGSVVTINGQKINICNPRTQNTDVYDHFAPNRNQNRATDKMIYRSNRSANKIERITDRLDNFLPDSSLEDISQFAMLHSNCWKQNILADTFYTTKQYVNKGENKGMFLMRKKGIIHNVRMEYSIGLIFCISTDANIRTRANNTFDESEKVSEKSKPLDIRNDVKVSKSPRICHEKKTFAMKSPDNVNISKLKTHEISHQKNADNAHPTMEPVTTEINHPRNKSQKEPTDNYSIAKETVIKKISSGMNISSNDTTRESFQKKEIGGIHTYPSPSLPKVSENIDNFQFICDPQEDDVLLFAIPVIGSVESHSNYKFSKKYVPAKNKKGKIAKEVTQEFLSFASPNEKDCINNIGDVEWLNVIIGESRSSK